MVILTVVRRKKFYHYEFDTVAEAYRKYLRSFSTFGDWWYYWRYEHTLLCRVNDPDIMEVIFRKVFLNACIDIVEKNS